MSTTVPARRTDGDPPLRLRLTRHPSTGRLDGGWWPYTRDVAAELRHLADHFPDTVGRPVRALVSPPDWDDWPHHPRRVAVAHGGSVKIGGFPRDDTHEVRLLTAAHAVMHLLVVPPATDPETAEQALRHAASGAYRSGTSVLQRAMGGISEEEREHWSDDGGR